MIFKIIFLQLAWISFLSTALFSYEMMPGQYSMKLVLTDSKESYPVTLKFSVDDFGKVANGDVDYPTYMCKAKLSASSQNDLKITTKETMLQGFDSCNPSIYTFEINKNSFFSPSSQSYFSISMFDGEENVKIKINSYTYKQTAYAQFRIKNKFSSIANVFNTTNSSILREYIKLSKTKTLISKAQEKLNTLITLENTEFNSIKNSQLIQDYKNYITTYPGSAHIQASKNSIASIEKNLLIQKYRKESNADSFYKAYNLSNSNSDIHLMLAEIKNLKAMDEFFLNKNELLKNELVKNQYVVFYRNEKKFDGFMSAYEITRSKDDIQNAYKLANTVTEKRIIEIALFKHFGESKFLDIKVGKSSESDLKILKSSSFLSSFRGMGKDYFKTLVISLDNNKGIKFQYAKYKVNLALKLDLDYTPHINGKDQDYIVEKISVILDNTNSYSKNETLTFKNVPVQGEYHFAAIKGIKFLAGLMGQDTSDVSEEIPIKLNNRAVTYEVISIETL